MSIRDEKPKGLVRKLLYWNKERKKNRTMRSYISKLQADSKDPQDILQWIRINKDHIEEYYQAVPELLIYEGMLHFKARNYLEAQEKIQRGVEAVCWDGNLNEHEKEYLSLYACLWLYFLCRKKDNSRKHVVNSKTTAKEVAESLTLNAGILKEVAERHRNNPDELDESDAMRFTLSFLRLTAATEESMIQILAKEYRYPRHQLFRLHSAEIFATYSAETGEDDLPFVQLKTVRNLLSHAVRPLPAVKMFLEDPQGIPGVGSRLRQSASAHEIVQGIVTSCSQLKKRFDDATIGAKKKTERQERKGPKPSGGIRP
jgi:hypothetical protein